MFTGDVVLREVPWILTSDSVVCMLYTCLHSRCYWLPVSSGRCVSLYILRIVSITLDTVCYVTSPQIPKVPLELKEFSDWGEEVTCGEQGRVLYVLQYIRHREKLKRFVENVEDKLNVVFGYIGNVAIMQDLSRMLQLSVPEWGLVVICF